MSPEGREKLKQIVKCLLEYIEIPETFSDFVSGSIAEKNGSSWTVYVRGDDRTGAITADGATEYEAKENAWTWFSSIIEECKNS